MQRKSSLCLAEQKTFMHAKVKGDLKNDVTKLC